MADESIQTPIAPSQVDLSSLQEALGASLKEALKSGLQEIATQDRQAAQEATQQAQQRTQQAQQVQAQQADPMLQLMAPYLAPLALDSQLAIDAATFYGTTPESITYKDEIERISSAWRQQGRVVPRNDIWLYVQGVHRKEINEAEAKVALASQERARMAGTVGQGSPAFDQAETKDPYTMTQADLEKALSNVVF